VILSTYEKKLTAHRVRKCQQDDGSVRDLIEEQLGDPSPLMYTEFLIASKACWSEVGVLGLLKFAEGVLEFSNLNLFQKVRLLVFLDNERGDE